MKEWFTVYQFWVDEKTRTFGDSIELCDADELEYNHPEIHRRFIMNSDVDCVNESRITVRRTTENIARNWHA